MAIRAVLWDIDDTLFDYTSADRAGMQGHLAAEGLADRFPTVDRALGRWREITDLNWDRFAAGETDFQGQRRDRVRMFLGAELSDAEADAWFERYIVHFESAWSLFPDSLAVLDGLAADYRQAVLSNSSIRNQDRKLRVLGVRDHFEAVLCAAELGVAKPDAAAFHAACDALALDPGEVAYVGNEPDIDAGGAVAAGLAGVWLDRGGIGGRPELVRITDLGQLPGLLRGDTRFGALSAIG
ncbi:HAD family hydrolase [Streptomyces scopuliridis]|uniref:HAD family hydrolase n=1 Tax=Streptomyces scopuliridis TaxID=452529 RepID=A0ACD4ZH11_9ACTN|nr:HAD family hydrolase [Streptomyces scopuliridis]WSB33201.1 HAD family hydrolase [Streptomyces scopuliridis]WSB97459.1 HAD family hydrolase [Streptomyces scopuliridis]WSC08838.1 HAD family hydrolase [Streptomyces scopuliridis]